MKRPHGGASDPEILDFSANVNPLGPPDGVRAALHPDLITRYPSADAREFREKIARHGSIPAKCLIAGNGSTDLIYLIARSLSGGRARVIVPAFTEYEDALESAGVSVNRGGETVTWIGNPSSPEGRLTPRAEILEIPGALVVDEAFMDFTDERESLVAEAARDPRLIVIRTLTKFYALPGLRLGYAIAVPETIARLKRLQAPWTVNALAAAAGIAALADSEYASFTRRFVRERREELHRGLSEAGLESLPSSTNFILCRVADAALLCRELLSRGIAARNCDSFTGLEKNRYVRFAVRKRSDNERLMATLTEIRNPKSEIAIDGGPPFPR